MNFLLREVELDEDDTRNWIAQMILCVEEIHNKGWIHRDIKPDNFLISCSGHLKITDFGLAFNGHWTHSTDYYNYHRYRKDNEIG